MKKILLANWKANLSPERAMQWCEVFAATYRPHADLEMVVAVPSLMLERVAAHLRGRDGIALAAQGVSPYPQGNYTGSTPAAWLRGLVRYTLIGHRERRRYFHETVQDVARQAYESLAEELQPIVCVDRELLIPQTAAMAAEELPRLIWAYTPETPKTLEMARSEREIVALLPQIARSTDNGPVLYGGGVTVDNAASLWQLAGISGLLMGRGCLDAAVFAALINRL
ncbi:Triose-phosphate isomerase [Desulfobulbus propionicus DSM 2032]|jgi:triosephosphate isomerase|uniref:Triosephosphate isomerase n=1 Tax=Desulfobulbus propionicus (strain ATCC 33891 / DSM 2032 / VKM B-1956 / 1pr3) TaxID=577650 RepID=A0A7U3YJF0_DESPD|nr:triose-phosphate isomerase family protein [Desulfobulbus propionicus]ADW16503.1 Triose-phosphate isomerase [Desulfobulbus propionicus DSM 2032]